MFTHTTLLPSYVSLEAKRSSRTLSRTRRLSMTLAIPLKNLSWLPSNRSCQCRFTEALRGDVSKYSLFMFTHTTLLPSIVQIVRRPSRTLSTTRRHFRRHFQSVPSIAPGTTLAHVDLLISEPPRRVRIRGPSHLLPFSLRSSDTRVFRAPSMCET